MASSSDASDLTECWVLSPKASTTDCLGADGRDDPESGMLVWLGLQGYSLIAIAGPAR
jgi:hypothetical protein